MHCYRSVIGAFRRSKSTEMLTAVTARENHDTACLNFALSWLLYLRQATPNTGSRSFRSISGLIGNGSGEQDEIAFLKAKARDTKNWSLMSTTLLEEAKLEMYSVSTRSCAFLPSVHVGVTDNMSREEVLANRLNTFCSLHT